MCGSFKIAGYPGRFPGYYWRLDCSPALVRFLLVFFLSCCICAAQSVTIGAIGGGRVTDDVVGFHTPESNIISGVPPFRPESRLYVVGPAIEIGLPHHFGVELDALYHRQGVFYTFLNGVYTYTTSGERDNIWEFPVLLKYKLRAHAMNPFVEVGVAPRTMSGRITEINQDDFSSLGPPSSTTRRTSYGPDAGLASGGGIRFHLAHLTIAPQVRYTRWFDTPVSGADYARIGGTFSSNLNQMDALVGIGWRVK